MLIVLYYLWSIIKVYSTCGSRLKGYTNYLLFKDKRAFYRYTILSDRFMLEECYTVSRVLGAGYSLYKVRKETS